jgi:hypothetical protein
LQELVEGRGHILSTFTIFVGAKHPIRGACTLTSAVLLGVSWPLKMVVINLESLLIGDNRVFVVFSSISH